MPIYMTLALYASHYEKYKINNSMDNKVKPIDVKPIDVKPIELFNLSKFLNENPFFFTY
jgi:hypothetical protein